MYSIEDITIYILSFYLSLIIISITLKKEAYLK